MPCLNYNYILYELDRDFLQVALALQLEPSFVWERAYGKAGIRNRKRSRKAEPEPECEPKK